MGEVFTPVGEAKRQIDRAVEAAGYLWEKGWAERNGGNISVNLNGLTDDFDLTGCLHVPRLDIPSEAAGMVMFVTGTGKRLRDLRDPTAAACVLRVDENADGYHIVWGGNSEGFAATSELPSHIGLHLSGDVAKRAVLHTHPTEIIALTHHPALGFDGEALNNALWSMLPEVRAFVPRGVCLIPYLLPGSVELAEATASALASHDVAVWAKHGALALGHDALDAFDFIDVANKGAMIYLRCLAAGFKPVGLSPIRNGRA